MSKEQFPTLAQRRLAKVLPPDLYQPGQALNKKEQSRILTHIAEHNPDGYPAIVERLNEIGIEAARLDGSSTFGIADMKTPIGAKIRRREMQDQIRQIIKTTSHGPERKEAIQKVLVSNVNDDMEEIYEELKAENSPFVAQVDNAGRGNKSSIVSIVAGELAALDDKDDVIPLLIDRSFSQGLSPGQYRAMQAAARKGMISAKLSVASSGYANKTMSQAVHRLVVTAQDDDTAIGRGLPVATDDRDNDGALLAMDYGPFKRNTVITPKIRARLKSMGKEEILVRSPIASGARDGGVLAADMGERNYGRLPQIGEFANLAASNALGEGVTQATLNAKHNANIDVDNLSDEEEFELSGFELIDKVLNPSSERRGFAVHANADGRIGLSTPAPQGGNYVHIGGEKHYLPQGAKFNYKAGDKVEAGDQLTEGIPDHVAVTRHQGLGEGRRRVMDAFAAALKKNGQTGHRRNLEVLARGLLDRVQMTEEYGDYIPDDVVPYYRMEAEWQPRETSLELPAKRAEGKYLEKPVMHYTIGTKIRPSVIKKLQQHGFDNVLVNDEPPPFLPTVVRAVDVMQTDEDWMTRQLGGHSRRSFNEAVMRGRSSDTQGSSYIGSRAELTSFNRGDNVIKLDEPKATDNIL